ncbi:glycerophosphodiester phosphodiesterase family protein [Fodinibius sediminis]|uniref:Glycerophosphoryl diester phosphodiesterase n=1 Tax=Fodinibius sediminis TaxID=1214077 RepID=A0A521BZJ3_9BACT|nr:glycerophosphodiester phosphodiesterase family protein [Fodinibius sediminis]SMO52597.1 glycerophosphoryl diester phosphodiesterase [Fodinibius sediminis]
MLTTNANDFFLTAVILFLISSLFVFHGCGMEKPDPPNAADAQIEIVAHRGDSYAKPENTMASVQSAWEKDADAVEVDVYLSADNRVVAIHDKTTKRTGDKDLPVKKTDSEKLRTVDVGSFKGEKFAGEQIPFLEEVVASVPPKKRLFIEVKDSARAISHIKEVIEQSGKKDQMVVISFGLEVVKASKEQMPDVPAYWLRSAPRDADTGEYQAISTNLLDQVRKHNLDGLDVHYQGVTPELVEASHQAGFKIFVWTVNDSADITAMAEQGVDGITTDRVIRARQALGKTAR